MNSNSSGNIVSAFSEEIVLMNGSGQLNASEQDAIESALMNNSAVGIVAGRYDAQLSISFVSSVFMKNLGYTNEDFLSASNPSLLCLVYPADRELFDNIKFREMSGVHEFRMLSASGAPVYVHAYKEESLDAYGKAQWVLSMRVSHDTVAMNQLSRGLNRLVARFAICDFENDFYEYYSDDGKYAKTGKYSQFLEDLDQQLRLTAGSGAVSTVMAPSYIRSMIATQDDMFKFDYMSADETVYYHMSVIPLEWDNGQLAKILMIGQDVTQAKLEEMRGQQALRDACLAANRANDAKSEFLSNMSHDIRTPMNAIIGMTAIAGANVDNPERVSDCLGKINSASRHLLGLINEVLDMSRIERGKMELSEMEFNLPDLVDNLIEMVRPGIIEHNHDFEVRIRDINHERVIGDPLRIQQVFTNVMGNAIKYTPDGGRILLTISEKDTHSKGVGCFEFIVEDNGIGMDAEFVKKIFEPFARADNQRISAVQGTGLGMTITKNLVELMDGTIEVESEPEKGSTFTTTIFLRLAEDEQNDDSVLANLPVLVVDDDTVCAESTVATLESIGMDGEWVDNGADAVQKVTDHHQASDDYFAVIMDWKMPGMDGLEATRRIRKAVGPDIPIILLSAYDYTEIEQEARMAGVDTFVSKPLFKSRLEAVFKRLVAGDSTRSAEVNPLQPIEDADYSDSRILIVEDNELNAEIMVELVGETGAMVEVAHNGKEAVDKVAEAPLGFYDLVFMDIQMPVMNGYEATTAIRALDGKKGKALPIVALTANAFAEDVILAKNAGVNEHVAKPISIEKLNEVMVTWLTR